MRSRAKSQRASRRTTTRTRSRALGRLEFGENRERGSRASCFFSAASGSIARATYCGDRMARINANDPGLRDESFVSFVSFGPGFLWNTRSGILFEYRVPRVGRGVRG